MEPEPSIQFFTLYLSNVPDDLPSIPIIPFYPERLVKRPGYLYASDRFELQADSFSTYPNEAAFRRNADSYYASIFDEMGIITISDGCGLSINSQKASRAAIEGFLSHLSNQTQLGQLPNNTRELGSFLLQGIQAAHMHIFWKAYVKNKEDLREYLKYLKSQIVLKEKKIHLLKQEIRKKQSLAFSSLTRLQNVSSLHLQEELDFFEKRITSLKEENELIKSASKSNFNAQKKLLENEWSSSWFQKEVGASTFLSAYLFPHCHNQDIFHLVCANVGDCQAFLYRQQEVHWLTLNKRPLHTNLKDPGGRIGKCTPQPLTADLRNLTFSLSEIRKNDLVFFITDGVWDNLDPMHLGFKVNGSFANFKMQQHFMEAANLNPYDLKQLQRTFTNTATNWNALDSHKAQQAKAKFSQTLIQILLKNTYAAEEALSKLMTFCQNITVYYRKGPQKSILPPYSGKPDHTTALVLRIN